MCRQKLGTFSLLLTRSNIKFWNYEFKFYWFKNSWPFRLPKGQLISKANFEVFILTKKLTKILYSSSSIIFFIFFFSFFHFRELGQKYKNIFVWFFVQMKTSKFAFEINWPLDWLPKILGFAVMADCQLCPFMQFLSWFSANY